MSELIGSAVFLDSTSNSGTVSNAVFSDTASNDGAVSVATFEGNASNTGTVTTASFDDSAVNSGSVDTASFIGNATNNGTILEAASFSGSATNSGAVSGSVVFSGSAVNVGVVEQAVFLDGAANTGTISLSASFFGSSSNSGTIAGDAVFADTTSNSGTVEGSAQVAETAANTGTVDGSVTTYVQPDGAWANGYFSSGTKTAPPSYATVAYQVQGLSNVWYVYDASGNGSLADGVYNDGVSDFVYVGGIKTVASTPWNTDYSTAARTVEIVNDVTLTNVGGGVKAATFDGNSFLRIEDSSAFNFGSGDFTIEFFVRSSYTTANEGTLVTTASPSDFTGVWMGLGGDGVGLYAGAGGAWAFGYGVPNLFDDNTWMYVALTRHNGVFKMYNNGNLIWTENNNVSLNNSNNRIQIGGRSGQYLTGDIACLRVVKGTALYTGSTHTVPTSVLTNIANTELLLTFGASNVPTIVNTYNGAYSFGYTNDNLIDISYNNSTPQEAQDDNLYYTYALGVATLANNTAPVLISGTYYTYVSGVQTAAEGRYSNGAYVAGAIDTGGTYDGEGTAQDDNQTYTYTSGVVGHAAGAYSDGYYSNGAIDTSYNNSTPQAAVDDSLYYTYTSGVATAAEGRYSTGAYVAGAIDTGGTYDTGITTVYQSIDDNLYYTYSSGVATAAEGRYSNGAYVAGAIDTGGVYDTTVPWPAGGVLGGPDHYTYAAGVATLAVGAYSNGYFNANGAVDTSRYTVATAQDDNQDYFYTAGQYAVAAYAQVNSYYSTDATLSNGSSVLRYDDYSLAANQQGTYNNNGAFDFGTGNSAIVQPWATDGSGVITWYENSVSILGSGGAASFYTGTITTGTTVLIDGNLNLYANQTGAFDLGGSAYEFTTDGSGVVTYTTLTDGNYSYGSYSSGSLDTSYSSTVPVQAINNGLWYTYASGVATAAEGRYSNGAYVAGAVDSGGTYDGTGTAQDDNETYSYSTGIATPDSPPPPPHGDGAYSDGYYSGGAIDSSYDNPTPLEAVDQSGTYRVYNGANIYLAGGAYSNYYFSNPNSVGSGNIDTSYNSSTPVTVQDNAHYYTFASGVATLAVGAYSSGYYDANGDFDAAYNINAPVPAQDDSLYYTYASGVPTAASNGAYSNYYITNGSIDSGYNSTVPVIALDTGLYYTYSSGVATAAEGRYSNGAYVAGAIDTGGTYDGEGTAQDDSQTYTYSGGAIV
jgi:hypothetical protein